MVERRVLPSVFLTAFIFFEICLDDVDIIAKRHSSWPFAESSGLVAAGTVSSIIGKDYIRERKSSQVLVNSFHCAVDIRTVGELYTEYNEKNE